MEPADGSLVSVTLSPLLDAAPVIQIHAFAAIAAFVIGAVQLSAPKGTIPHRLVGWLWAVSMLTVAISSLSSTKSAYGVRGARSISCRS
jgi:uncharacterized membrane protein